MPGPKSDDDVTVGFSAFKYCTYKKYLNPKNLQETVVGQNPHIATCGFNQDTLFYCPPQQGDTPVATLQNKFFSFLNTIDEQRLCHFNTRGFDYANGELWGCAALRKKDKDQVWLADNMWDWISGDSYSAWPNVANNADCVKKYLTQQYWHGSSIMASLKTLALVMTSFLF